MSELVFVVPGRLNQLTGGYLYDRHIVEGLRARGRVVRVIELGPTRDRATFAAIPGGTATVIDGLAFPGLEHAVAAEAHRLRLVAFVHHPLAEETGLSRAEAERAARIEAAMLPRFRGVPLSQPENRRRRLAVRHLPRPDRRCSARDGKADRLSPTTARPSPVAALCGEPGAA